MAGAALASSLYSEPSQALLARSRREARGESSSRLMSEINSLGIEELKQKIRDVAQTRRERLQGVA